MNVWVSSEMVIDDFCKLSKALPLGGFCKFTLIQRSQVYHVGSFDSSIHRLDRPLWVVEDPKYALRYADSKSLFTVLTLRSPIHVFCLDKIKLGDIENEIAGQIGEKRKKLVSYLLKSRVLAVQEMKRDIFLANPFVVIGDMRSFKTEEIFAEVALHSSG